MDLETVARVVLVFAHLLLCVFALREVLVADWQLLRRGLRARQMQWLHRRVGALLIGLWITGLALAEQPKLLLKLLVVAVLTLNGVLLHRWCFPRVGRLPGLPFGERLAVLMAGAASTASWLVAAFLGTARPLKAMPLASLLLAYGAVLALAALAAAALALWRWPREAGSETKTDAESPVASF
jgi:uncharacterized membrane protein YidH (DUF202 family)